MWIIAQKVLKPMNLLRTHRQPYSLFTLNQSLSSQTHRTYTPPISDHSSAQIYEVISELTKKPYLSQLKQDQAQAKNERTGLIHPFAFISLPTKNLRINSQKPIWVHYLIDTNCPFSLLTQEAAMALKFTDMQPEAFHVKINGIIIPVLLSRSNFNILGADYVLGDCQPIIKPAINEITLIKFQINH